MNIDLKYLEEYKKAAFVARVYRKLTLPLLVLGVVLGVIGIVVTAGNSNESLLSLAMISFFVYPAIIISFLFLTQSGAYKRLEALKKELFTSKVLADDILKFGEENGIDLFSVALEARCFHELGLKGVPEWCFRDSALPSREDYLLIVPEARRQ